MNSSILPGDVFINETVILTFVIAVSENVVFFIEVWRSGPRRRRPEIRSTKKMYFNSWEREFAKKLNR